MQGHHAVYMTTSTYPLFLKAKAQGIFGIIKVFRAANPSFAKLALQETKKGTVILLIVTWKEN